MKNKNGPIKQENKKAMPKFFLVFAVCLTVGLALGFLLVAGHFSGMMHGGSWVRPAHTFLGLGAFLFILTGSTIFQQKLVDTTKRLNPEKHGSVYDTKFHEKWLASCDEAERAVIG